MAASGQSVPTPAWPCAPPPPPRCFPPTRATPAPAQVRALDSHKLAAAAGPQADTVRFVEYIQRNLALNEFRTGLKLSVAAAAAYVRTELATALRKSPYQANLLIGGVDESGPALFFMDYLASCAFRVGVLGWAGGATGRREHLSADLPPPLPTPPPPLPPHRSRSSLRTAAPVNYGAQGYAGYFVTSLFDRHWRAGMNEAEGVELARQAIKEIRTRMVVATPKFSCKIVTKAGIKSVDIDAAAAAAPAAAMDVEALAPAITA